MPYVYADLFLLLNAAIDLALLFSAARLAGERIVPWRLVVAACGGAVYALAYLYWPTSIVFRPLGGIVAALIMLLLAFGPFQNSARCLRLLLSFLTVTSLAAGISLGLRGSNFAWSTLPTLTAQSSWWNLAPAMLLLLLGGTAIWRWMQRSLNESERILRIIIECRGQTVSLMGLVDTGNQLIDPLSGRPALVAEARSVGPLLPPAIRRVVTAGSGWTALPKVMEEGWEGRFVLLPYGVVGGDGGILLGFRPDRILIGADQPDPVLVTNVVVALNPGSLTGTGQFQALLPPEVTGGGWQQKLKKGEGSA